MKTVVHPAFDPVAGVWFVDVPELEAKSLALLKTKLGAGFKITGYYPKGFTVIRPGAPDYSRRLFLPSSVQMPQFVLPRPKRPEVLVARREPVRDQTKKSGPPKGVNTKYDHEAILDMWAAGMTGRQIQERLGLKNPTTAGVIVADHRNNHPDDPRSAYRKKK